MDINHLINRSKGIIINPEAEWQTISGESTNSKDVFLKFVLPFLILNLISFIIGSLLFSKFFALISILMAIVSFIVYVIVLFVTPIIIQALGKSFNTEVNKDHAFKLVAYSFTPSYIINIIVGLIPALGILGILGLYGIYIMWLGFSKLLNTPEDKKVGFFIVTLLIIIGEMVILSMILGAIVISAFGMGTVY